MDENQTIYEWREASARTKADTARGVCGFAQYEMVTMSDHLLQTIIDVFNSCPKHGLLGWLMLAKVVLIAKTATATQIPEMRPITVFALVFRIWCKVTARKLLRQWKLHIPGNVVGAIPGRTCTSLILRNALRIELFAD